MHSTAARTRSDYTHTLRRFLACSLRLASRKTGSASLVAGAAANTRASDICLTDSSRWRHANGISAISSSSCLPRFMGDASSGTSGSGDGCRLDMDVQAVLGCAQMKFMTVFWLLQIYGYILCIYAGFVRSTIYGWRVSRINSVKTRCKKFVVGACVLHHGHGYGIVY
jgi:hypothetical protein